MQKLTFSQITTALPDFCVRVLVIAAHALGIGFPAILAPPGLCTGKSGGRATL